MTFRPRWLSYDQIRVEAEEFLDEYHPARTAPIPIESIVEFDLNMDVIPIDGLKAELDVDAFLTNNLEWIYCDEWVISSAPSRFRFSLAHEVAHWWMHDELYKSSEITSVADYRRVVESIDPEDYKLFESQANNFAGLVLAPRAPLAEAFKTEVSKAVAGGVARDQIDHHPTRQFIVRAIAAQFELSELVIEIRLERDGLLARLPTPT